jgi:glycerol uptake facilitator-like aquaporin
LQAIVLEVLGSMLLTFLYLTQTEEKTKVSGDPAISTMIIAATYATVIGYSMGLGVVTVSAFNPAIALGNFWAVLFSGNFDRHYGANMWVCLAFSYAGSLLAVVLFEFVYKKAILSIENKENASSSEDEKEEQLVDRM